MKISDLRIGNQILAKRLGMYIPAIITLLSDFDDFENWKPEPITLEALNHLKFTKWNGFDGGYVALKQMKGEKLMIREWQGRWLPFICTINKGLYKTVLELHPIDYVHELQNLYKGLCQVDL